jgi:hypothetical protein
MKAETDYLAGKGSIARIAREMGLAEPTVRHWAYNDGWVQKRDRLIQKRKQALEASLQADPEPAPVKSAPDAGQTGESQQERTHGQIAKLDDAIESCTDPAQLVRLCDAKAKLYGLIYPKPARLRPSRRRPEQPFLTPIPDPVPCRPASANSGPGVTMMGA